MTHTVKIHQSEDEILLLESQKEIARQIINTGATEVEIRVIDPRSISDEQRKKARVLVGEIAQWSGSPPDYIHDFMKYDFCVKNDMDWFSLSDCDMTTARLYITYLIDFCIKWDVPTKQPLYAFCDDLEAYVYQCLAQRKCAVHNTPGSDIHHCTGYRVGMGRNREVIIHEGLVCLPLCRICHTECHAGEQDFLAKHHLVGLPLDKYLCLKLGMKAKAN